MKHRWQTRLSEALIAERRESGEWDDRTLAGHLDELCAVAPDRALVIERSRTTTARELREEARALVAALNRRGVVAGDVVSFQLPNWREAIAIELACTYGGFVCNPIVTIYREAEVRHIVQDACAKVFFVPHTFRGYDYVAMVERIEATWNGETETIVVRPEGLTERASYEAVIQGAPPADGAFANVDANDVKLLLYTSGTTGAAKGVLHTHNTIGAEIRNVAAYFGLDGDDVILMPSPLGHITGYLYGIQLPITLQCPVVLMDRWDASQAADLIDDYGVTLIVGATPFVQELAHFAEKNRRPLASLRLFPTGGAAVPPEVIHAAHRALANCSAFRIYGSTEAPTVTLGAPGRDRLELGATTEGFVVGHDVRLTDQDGRSVEPGQEGEIRTRGPENCVGYAHPEFNDDAFDEEGYFLTGDLAHMTPQGCLIITGRSKDLIIRGGENISPKEIEDVLHTLPQIGVAAVVAMPHSRLGETCCAFVTLKPGQSFDFEAMAEALSSSGLAKQKYPEHLEVVPELPYTAAGKVRKNLLRERISEIVASSRDADVIGPKEEDTPRKATRNT